MAELLANLRDTIRRKASRRQDSSFAFEIFYVDTILLHIIDLYTASFSSEVN